MLGSVKTNLKSRSSMPIKSFTVAASFVAVLAIASAARGDVPIKRPARHSSAVLAHQAERMASDAIARYLRESVADEAWRVTSELSDEQVQLIGVAEGPLVAIGGESPWIGNQTFELRVKGNGAAPLTVKADVALPPTIVVATHAVPRGTVVRASDIQLQRVSAETSVTGGFQLAEDVVGKEATKSISPGQTIDANYVRPQILVHSGEVVTLYGRNAGITVRMTARAQENGAQGELVSIESILDRKRLLARVCGLQEVEIFAGAAASAANTIQGRSEKATRNE
jgi:flagella basal body P-ring formation protein FlgA